MDVNVQIIRKKSHGNSIQWRPPTHRHRQRHTDPKSNKFSTHLFIEQGARVRALCVWKLAQPEKREHSRRRTSAKWQFRLKYWNVVIWTLIHLSHSNRHIRVFSSLKPIWFPFFISRSSVLNLWFGYQSESKWKRNVEKMKWKISRFTWLWGETFKFLVLLRQPNRITAICSRFGVSESSCRENWASHLLCLCACSPINV